MQGIKMLVTAKYITRQLTHWTNSPTSHNGVTVTHFLLEHSEDVTN